MLRDFCARRAVYYAALPGLARYGLGWLHHTLATHGAALALRAA
ncbi:hypothetical protein ACFOW6_05015 [Fodinicurvata halophila]|uniref:Uncharacterized protein n=1 Tax=Fodinicurvata halophila TaxID=1419723 RepID=A0ABV8UJB8_9PROT